MWFGVSLLYRSSEPLDEQGNACMKSGSLAWMLLTRRRLGSGTTSTASCWKSGILMPKETGLRRRSNEPVR